MTFYEFVIDLFIVFNILEMPRKSFHQDTMKYPFGIFREFE